MGGNNVRHSKYHQNVFSPSTQPLSQTVVVAPTDQRSTYVSTEHKLEHKNVCSRLLGLAIFWFCAGFASDHACIESIQTIQYMGGLK